MGRARIAEKSDDLACIVDAESLSALGQGSIQRGEAAAAEDETVKDAVGPESSDDLARAVDAKWVGVLGGQGIVDRGEDIDWHVVALLIADGCHQHYQLAIARPTVGRSPLLATPHACCGVVSNGCCDVSSPRKTLFESSAASPPKPAIACTS